MTTNRSTIRAWLATYLEGKLVGSGLPVKTVTDSKVSDLVGNTPLVAVLSGGSERAPMTFQGPSTTFYLSVQVWVRQSGSGWTASQAEDALDNIEHSIASAYYESDPSYVLDYDGRSTVIEATVNNEPYYLESIPTTVTLNRS